MADEKKEYHFIFRCACGDELRISDPTTEDYTFTLPADGERCISFKCNGCNKASVIYSKLRIERT